MVPAVVPVAHFVDMNTRFDARRGSRTWEQLCSRDGHCNDDGYRLMAEVMADALTPIVSAIR